MIAGTPAHPGFPARNSTPPFLPRAVSVCWLDRRFLIAGLLVLLALVPLAYVGLRSAEAGRNVVYWDEFETALALVLRLDTGLTPGAFLDELFAVNNEHRMVTSRLMFALSYWCTGTVNFSVVSLVGNGTLVALCLLLVGSARTAPRRLRLGLLLAFGLFQLENYENFLWSGSSIDHFQVLLYVGATVVALARGTRPAWLAAGLFALLASLTLAHGLLVWPLGAAMLWRARRYPQLAGWCAFAAVVAGGYAAGFSVNSAHRFAGWSGPGALAIVRYWLTLLGSVPAFGYTTLAPWFGAALLALLGWLGWHRAPRRDPVAFPLAWFGAAALALVAVGRTEQVGGLVMSRYIILAALSWSLTAFMLLGRFSHPRRPLAALGWCLPGLVLFNLGANRAFTASADSWLECRDLAATRFKQHGVDGRGNFSLHPSPARSTELLAEAERRGLYRLGSLCFARSFPAAQPSSQIKYFVDELTVTRRSAFIRGWAALPGVDSARDQIHIVLRSAAASYIFTTVNAQRPDVADAFHEPGWQRSGFVFARRRDRLPSGDYQLGFLIKHGSATDYIMTEHRLVLENEGRALLAVHP